MICKDCIILMWMEPTVLSTDPAQYVYRCPRCERSATSFLRDSIHIITDSNQWERIKAEAKENKESMEPKTKVQRHKELCDFLNDLYARKNADYGDSFHKSFVEEGMAMPRIRLGDKYNRFCSLTRGANSQQVNDESLRDTLIDLANYALMTVLELDGQT